jgi:hypothetical protein
MSLPPPPPPPPSPPTQALGVSSQSDRATIKKKVKDMRKAQEKLVRGKPTQPRIGNRIEDRTRYWIWHLLHLVSGAGERFLFYLGAILISIFTTIQ